jgi:hypothetical protein
VPIWHKTLKERFATLPTFQQTLMVANELNRAQNMLTVPQEYHNAMERALELTDFISTDKRWIHKLAELRRARETMAMLYAASVPQSTEILQKCFVQLDASAWKYINGSKD